MSTYRAISEPVMDCVQLLIALNGKGDSWGTVSSVLSMTECASKAAQLRPSPAAHAEWPIRLRG
jgi:hypothetical protein